MESWARVGVAVEVGDEGADLSSSVSAAGVEKRARQLGEGLAAAERKETGRSSACSLEVLQATFVPLGYV